MIWMVSMNEGSPIAAWFSWKIPSINRWWLGLPPMHGNLHMTFHASIWCIRFSLEAHQLGRPWIHFKKSHAAGAKGRTNKDHQRHRSWTNRRAHPLASSLEKWRLAWMCSLNCSRDSRDSRHVHFWCLHLFKIFHCWCIVLHFTNELTLTHSATLT